MAEDYPEERTIDKDGYRLTFYPGFASRCTVRNQGGEVELYRQVEPYHLPKGETRPRDRYRIRLEGGTKKQDVTFDVYDPELRIKRITVELYGEDHDPGTGNDADASDVVTLDNNGVLCPPTCPPGG